MRIKVGADLPQAAVEMLRKRCYEAAHVVEQGMGDLKDPALWEAVPAEERFLVTADKGFADIRAYLLGTHAGVLLLRPDQDGIRPVIELLQQVLAGYDLSALVGAVAVVTARGIRIRRARASG